LSFHDFLANVIDIRMGSQLKGRSRADRDKQERKREREKERKKEKERGDISKAPLHTKRSGELSEVPAGRATRRAFPRAV